MYCHKYRTPVRSSNVSGTPENRASTQVVFLDRDGVLNEECGHITTPEQLVLIPRSAEAVRLINKQNWLCLVASNQSVLARGWVTQEQFNGLCKKMNRALEQSHAHIDDLFYCPHLPSEKGGVVPELSRECPCRKPATGLFDQAARKYGISATQAVFIGDSTSDFEAAARWGMLSIGVRTGFAGKDGKFDRRPDIWAEDLYDAVQQLLTHWPKK